VLLADDFTDPAKGWLPMGPAPNGMGTRAYLNGEYQIVRPDPNSRLSPSAVLPGTFRDASMAFDVRFVSPKEGQQINVRCRNKGDNGYRFELRPEARAGLVTRLDDDNRLGFSLSGEKASLAIRRGESNRVEITCAGPNPTLSVNGQVVATAQDSTYTSGNFDFSGIFGPRGGPVDVRIAHLVVTQR
jgi:hypothetical protein